MARKKRAAKGRARRRLCGTMAAHMRLLEAHASFRGRQQRLELATARRRSLAAAAAVPTLVTVDVVVNVVYRTEAQNVSDAQIKSQIDVLNRDYAATNTDKSKVPAGLEGARHRLAGALQAGEGGAEADDEGVVRHRRLGQAGLLRRDRALLACDAPEPLGVRALGRGAGLRAVPGRAGGDRRRRHRLPGVRDSRHRAGAVQPGADGDPRGGPLLQPAAHLGGHRGLLGERLRGRHAERGGAELRHAHVPVGLLRRTGRTGTCS